MFSIGPNWALMLVLIAFAFMIVSYFGFMLSFFKVPLYMKLIMTVMIIANLTAMAVGMLKNPGIPQSVIDLKLKQQMGRVRDYN